MNYRSIKAIEYYTNALSVSSAEWKRLTKDRVKASKPEINRLIKIHYPELYHRLALNAYNPYNYYRTETHLIMIHSNIEYFFKIIY